MTNYNPTVAQNDASPCIGAALVDICKHEGRSIALSQDLVGRKGNKKFTYGDMVKIESSCVSGVFKVLDTMNPRFTNYVDVFQQDPKLNFGKCKGTVQKLVSKF